MNSKLYTFFLTGYFLTLSGEGLAFLSENNGYTPKEEVHKINSAEHIDKRVLDLSMRAYQCANKYGVDKRKEVMTIIDYSKPSSQKRMWVIDMKKNQVELEEFVAHGSGSGDNKATHFSNQSGSHQSSFGVFVTGNTYVGKNGLSLRLKGLEKGVNDKALSRAIVIHGANYVSEKFVKGFGRLGHSWGCPAIEPKLVKPTLNKIKDGSLVFAYYPDRNWLNTSPYLHC